MKGYQFVAEAGIGYRAELPGSLLEAAKKTEKKIPIKGKAGEEVDLGKTGWAPAYYDSSVVPVSICSKHFEADRAYTVYFVPDANPPYLYAVMKP